MSIEKKLQIIQWVITDVDGVLTDGKLHYAANGEQIKSFNVKDGVAFKLLPQYGINVAVVSAKSSPMLRCRLQELGVQHAGLGIKDKLSFIEQLAIEQNCSLDQILYVGDDMVDYPVLAKVGIAAMPADGYHLLQSVCAIQTNAVGGGGVLRELADMVLSARGSLLDFYKIACDDQFQGPHS